MNFQIFKLVLEKAEEAEIKLPTSAGSSRKQESSRKNLHDPDNHKGVITHTHLEPDILECDVRWALGSITTNKASGGEGIQVELFQILKDDAVKVLHLICQQTWKTQQWPQDWKRSVFIPIPKKGNAKECSNYHTIALISHTEEPEVKLQHLLDHQKSKRVPEKHLFLLY